MSSLREQLLGEKLAPEINRRLLVVDDNPAIHDDIRKILGRPQGARESLDELEQGLFGDKPRAAAGTGGFEIESAHQGAEGLEQVRKARQERRPFALCVVDMRMPPGWDGVETIEQLWREQPDLQVVICTAYSDHSWQEIVERLGISDNLLVLKKPFEPIELLQLAHTMSRKWSLQRQVERRLSELETSLQQCVDELDAANLCLQREVDKGARLRAAGGSDGGRG